MILNASIFSLTWIRSSLEDPYVCSAADSVHTGPRTQITTSFAILYSFQCSSVSIWVLKLRNLCRTLESRCYTSLVRGTLRIRVQNSLFCMSATSNTFYVELRSCHVSWLEAQQTLSWYQSAENHQRFLMEERTQEQVLATEARSLRWIYPFGDSGGKDHERGRGWTSPCRTIRDLEAWGCSDQKAAPRWRRWIKRFSPPWSTSVYIFKC